MDFSEFRYFAVPIRNTRVLFAVCLKSLNSYRSFNIYLKYKKKKNTCKEVRRNIQRGWKAAVSVTVTVYPHYVVFMSLTAEPRGYLRRYKSSIKTTLITTESIWAIVLENWMILMLPHTDKVQCSKSCFA